MSIRCHGLSARRAERLLRDASSGAPVGAEPLAHLLATAAAPAPEVEPAGEEAALAAFRLARQEPAPTTDTTDPGGRSGLASLLTAKAAAAVLAATAIGGVALAAGTGSLPGQHQRADQPPTRTQRESRPAGTPSGTAGRTVRPAPSPSPSLAGLCRAYERNGRKQRKNERDKALDGPALSRLITAAGGENRVAGYCATLLRTVRSKKPEPTPEDQTKKSTTKPSPQNTRPIGRSTRNVERNG